MDEQDLDLERWLDELADETSRCGYAAAQRMAWEEELAARLAAVPAPVDETGEPVPF